MGKKGTGSCARSPPHPSHHATHLANTHTSQGLDRYVKKKKLDALDTYVPLVLEARGVLDELDQVMGEGVGVGGCVRHMHY